MGNVRLKFSGKQVAGKKVAFLGGNLSFDEQCITEVSEERAEDLLEAYGGKFDVVEGKVKVEKKEEKSDKPSEKEETNEGEEPETKDESEGKEEDGDDFEEQLKNSTVKELKEIAEGAELDKKEWEGLRKAELQEYLMDKLAE